MIWSLFKNSSVVRRKGLWSKIPYCFIIFPMIEKISSYSEGIKGFEKEVLIDKVATCILAILHSPYMIPVFGLIIGHTVIHLAYKISAHYHLSFKPTHIQFFRTLQRFSRLKVIILIFAFVFAKSFPKLAMMMGFVVGLAIGMNAIMDPPTDRWTYSYLV